jgi:hypothetical protein
MVTSSLSQCLALSPTLTPLRGTTFSALLTSWFDSCILTCRALLIGTWANSVSTGLFYVSRARPQINLAQFLYMAELTQARYYFRHFKHDDWKLKVFPSALTPVSPGLFLSLTDVCIGRLLSRHCFHSGRLCVRVPRKR